MPLRSRIEPHETDRSPRYLPFLTWTLLILLLVYLLSWYLFYRPSTETEQQVASFQTALRYINRNYIDDVSQEKLYQGAMRGMVRALNNKYSYYLSPQEWKNLNEETEGQYVGIGVSVSQVNDWAVIANVFPNGPAAVAGIRAGDVIVTVDGHDAHEMSTDQLVGRIRGKPGSTVKVEVRRPAENKVLSFELTRANIQVPSAHSRMLEDGIGLLRIDSFDKNVAIEVRKALTSLKGSGMRALLIDLRSNAGGLMDQAVEICDMFLDKGMILSLAGRTAAGMPPIYADPQTEISNSIPIVVLVDQNTASAAEILSGALQANGRATVIGARTFGKGSVTNLLDLKDGSGIVLTVFHYVLAGNKVIEGRGVEPDVAVGQMPPYPVDDPAKAEAWRQAAQKAAREQEDRATQYLKQKLAGAAAPPEAPHGADAH